MGVVGTICIHYSLASHSLIHLFPQLLLSSGEHIASGANVCMYHHTATSQNFKKLNQTKRKQKKLALGDTQEESVQKTFSIQCWGMHKGFLDSGGGKMWLPGPGLGSLGSWLYPMWPKVMILMWKLPNTALVLAQGS